MVGSTGGSRGIVRGAGLIDGVGAFVFTGECRVDGVGMTSLGVGTGIVGGGALLRAREGRFIGRGTDLGEPRDADRDFPMVDRRAGSDVG